MLGFLFAVDMEHFTMATHSTFAATLGLLGVLLLVPVHPSSPTPSSIPEPTSFFNKLPVDIWIQVVELLTPTLPKPLSGMIKEEATGKAERGDIRADALAKLMATSIAFNRLVSRPLYQQVISDHPLLLTASYFTPRAHPSISSKRELLAHTTHLHLEYRHKNGQLSYVQLLEDSANWQAFGATSSLFGEHVQARSEMEDVSQAFKGLEHEVPFPRVSHVSKWNASQRRLGEVQRAGSGILWPYADQVLLQPQRFRSLALPERLQWLPKTTEMRLSSSDLHLPIPIFTTIPTFILHYELSTPYPFIAINCPTRIVLESSNRAYTWEMVREATSGLVINSVLETKEIMRHGGLESGSINLDVYSSCQRLDSSKFPPEFHGIIRFSDISERREVKELEDELRRQLEAAVSWPTHEGDALSLHAWFDAPKCECCCWKVDRLDEEQIETDGRGDQRVYLPGDWRT